MLLAGPDHAQQLLVVALRGVVEDQLGAVCVHALGGERMVEPDLAEVGDGGANALHRNAGAAQRPEHERLGEADERPVARRPGAGTP